eukprot:3556283-Pyramimonas_sp.AAC.1
MSWGRYRTFEGVTLRKDHGVRGLSPRIEHQGAQRHWPDSPPKFSLERSSLVQRWRPEGWCPKDEVPQTIPILPILMTPSLRTPSLNHRVSLDRA